MIHATGVVIQHVLCAAAALDVPADTPDEAGKLALLVAGHPGDRLVLQGVVPARLQLLQWVTHTFATASPSLSSASLNASICAAIGLAVIALPDTVNKLPGSTGSGVMLISTISAV